jgi:hypothetical protein
MTEIREPNSDLGSHGYSPPVIQDYGTLADLTAAVSFTGAEDGASKLLIHHVSQPIRP